MAGAERPGVGRHRRAGRAGRVGRRGRRLARHRSRRRHPALRLGPAREHDPVERLLLQAEQGAAGGEVADEAAVDLGADQLLGPIAGGPQGRAPGLERPDVVVRLRDEGLQPEVGLPAQDQLRQRRGHRLREDLRADQAVDGAAGGHALLGAGVVEADGLQPQPAARAEPGGGAAEEGPVGRHLLLPAEPVAGEVLGRLDADDGVVRAVGLVVDPALLADGDARTGAGCGQRSLRRTRCQADDGRCAVDRAEPVGGAAPAAADVEHAASAHLQGGREVVDLAVLRPFEGVLRVIQVPLPAGVHELRTEPEREELGRQVVVAGQRGR